MRSASEYRGARRNAWRGSGLRWRTDARVRHVPYLIKAPRLRKVRGPNGMPLLDAKANPMFYLHRPKQPKLYAAHPARSWNLFRRAAA